MDHAGSPSHCEEDCRDADCQWHGLGAVARNGASNRAPVAVEEGNGARQAVGLDLVVQAARADAAALRSGHPYLLQSGRTLFIVAAEPNVWVVAELTFDPDSCVFIERARAQFDWPREAFGRLLSRVHVAGAIDHEDTDTVADSFERWLAAQFVG